MGSAPPAISWCSGVPSSNSIAMKWLAGVLSDVVDGADVRMIQGRGGAGLALKPFDRTRISRQLLGEEFQRNDAPQPRVFGPVDDAHAALAQLLQDAIVRDGLADHPVVV